MTRFEQLKQMNIDELADFIKREAGSCDFCSRKDEWSCPIDCDCKQHIKEYLEREIEE